MRRALFQRGNRRQILPHDAVDLIIGNPLPLVTQEEGFARATELGVAHRHIVVQFRCQLLAEGNDTLFVALTGHLQLTAREVNIPVIQSYQFRASQTGLIE